MARSSDSSLTPYVLRTPYFLTAATRDFFDGFKPEGGRCVRLASLSHN